MGDVGGVRITADSMDIPPTPPPDIDVEAWHDSIELIRSLAPAAAGHDPLRRRRGCDGQLDELDGRLDDGRRWPATGEGGFIATVQAEILRHGSAEQAATYQQAAPVEQLYAGYERYWSRRG